MKKMTINFAQLENHQQPNPELKKDFLLDSYHQNKFEDTKHIIFFGYWQVRPWKNGYILA